MSNFIPPSVAASGAESVLRQTNEAVRARQVQLKKNAHHAEEVEDLDDQGVDAVKTDAEEQQGGGGEGGAKGGAREEDRVEIESLGEVGPAVAKKLEGGDVPRLDISA